MQHAFCDACTCCLFTAMMRLIKLGTLISYFRHILLFIFRSQHFVLTV